MHQNKTVILFISACILALVPTQAQAFSYTQVHSLWQEPAYTSATPPDYLGPTFPGWGLFAFFADPIGTFGTYPTYEAMCDSFATAQGYTNTTDFYCVYDSRMNSGSFGTPCFGTPCTPGNGTINIYNGFVKLYTTPPTQISFAALGAQLNAAWATYFSNSISGVLPNPVPTNPEVCDTSEVYNIVSGLTFDPTKSIPQYDRCNIYHHVGTPSSPPVASLTVSPLTPILPGSTALLTYSCSNAATSASIDNGVGSVSPAASGSVSVTPGSSTTYTLTCTNANGSGTAQATVSVVSLPDLTAGAITPTTATAGTPTALSATVSNTGPAAAAASPTLFQVQETSALISSPYNSGIASSGTAPSSASYTFPSSGTYTVRACANNTSSWLNIITESNTANNCGPWTLVSVAAAAAPPSCTFTASPTSSVPSTLTWACVNVTSCTGGGFSTGFGSPITGSAPVSAAGTYTLSCTGPSGNVTSSVTVGSSCSGTPTGTLTASQTRVRQGNPVTLTLSNISNVKTSCTLSGPGVSQTYSPTACTVSGASLPTPPIATQSVYTLTCDGVKVGSVVVNVIPNFTEF